jgi:multidrug efflux pump subunit AcrA (membrane-fusion protein)
MSHGTHTEVCIKMTRTLTALMTVGAVALAAISVPSKAQANPAWVIPALVVGGVVVAASVASANAYYAPGYYAPGRSVYVHPRVAGRCHVVRERTSGGWRRVEVCR